MLQPVESKTTTRFEDEVTTSIIMVQELTKDLTMKCMKSHFRAAPGISCISFVPMLVVLRDRQKVDGHVDISIKGLTQTPCGVGQG